ncbi:MAG: 1-phosphofructokinase [Oscillospiraceae bacterium]
MIYTVTLNPALDYIMDIGKLDFGKTNRSRCETIYPGGKGINVSIVLSRLGCESCAWGFLGGFTGAKLRNSLEEIGCKQDFVLLSNEETRINVKLRGQTETEINAIGPKISAEDMKNLLEKFEVLNSRDTLVLAGSIPMNCDKNCYEEMLRIAVKADAKCVVDTCGEPLLRTLSYRPFLIKPNLQELSEVLNRNIETQSEIFAAAQELQKIGARNVMVSCGKDGAYLFTQRESFFAAPPRGTLVNSVGAGDSMVAGFLADYEKYNDYESALKFAVKVGSATAYSDWLATPEML